MSIPCFQIFMQMRNDAIVCNIGHFDCEIDVKGCARFFGALTPTLFKVLCLEN